MSAILLSVFITFRLDSIALDGNSLRGSLTYFYQPIRYIDFSNNRLNGTIPMEFFYPSTLNYVYLFGNMLSGTIPSSFASSLSLVDLFLDQNNLTGTIPPITLGSLSGISEYM